MNDYAGLLSTGERQRLETKLAERERATGAQMAIAIFRSLEGEDVADVANRLFQKWRLGRKGLDNGVLLVVFVRDRKLRFEIGYGLEAVVPDAVAGQIIRQAVAPRFREQRWAAGLEAAVDAVYARIASGRTPSPEQLQRESESFRRRQRESEQTANLYALLFLALAGVLIGTQVLRAIRERGYAAERGYTAGRDGWSVGWSGGGSGGLGSSGWGGSSGGGGFSGGGGESGGGGASGDW